MTSDEKLRLEKEFGEISGRVWTLGTAEDTAAPDLLFHYTDARGLQGILNSNSLWATHFQFLNDSSEMRYGEKQARDVIDALAEKQPEKERFWISAAKLLKDVFEEEIASPYVVSFCFMGDLLSQWREYGDRGTGFSIGFDCEGLSKLFGPITSVLNIRYNPEDQRCVLSATFEEYCNLLLRWEHKSGERFDLPSAPERSLEEHCRAQLVSLLMVEFAAFKNPGFVEEQEWRLFRLGEGGSPRKFRTGRFGIVPYVEFKPPSGQRLPITKVIQGPTVDRTSAKRSVEMLLEDLGYAGVGVDVSTIPLR